MKNPTVVLLQVKVGVRELTINSLGHDYLAHGPLLHFNIYPAILKEERSVNCHIHDDFPNTLKLTI